MRSLIIFQRELTDNLHKIDARTLLFSVCDVNLNSLKPGLAKHDVARRLV